MVTNITNFGRSGLSDWLMQRASAVVLALYTLYMVGFFLTTSHLDYATWSGLFQGTGMRIFSLLALISLAAHAWIGLWTVSTDYIKPTGIRLGFQVVVILAMFAYLVWGVQVLWGA
ncbi:succinate dehydrogenase / fumarate reductase membrane anchor subunit [Allopseudospirillum japonicum]|uniref:Succinate dehydrogenase hydrophobic membrane anchor subunit n=1 Tax=Allopseudospirillum japonicum TaxID=64971 RepID=A0A1H6QC55_9GAMM|nr:succinate dehydrogenase, hydrophobic membrane anchor protein [Allopseudospirillum japonicum]SEI41328.1 succinate dehydrogenase / fumarate reductase membrane anchor subunit [Allopseudospirillum japonicum]